jgi:uncharacterized protein Veg
LQTYIDDFIINYGVAANLQKRLSFTFSPMATKP